MSGPLLLPNKGDSSRDHFLKLKRAEVHIDSLYERVQSFLNGNPYRLETELDSSTGEIVVYVEPLREPPMREWSVIIGDAVHNLRSALDHLVWQLTLANGHTPPAVIPPKGQPGSEWRDVQFPIYVIDPRKRYPSGKRAPWRYRWPGWSSKKVSGALWGVRPAVRTDLQRLQPFNYGQDAPKKPLAILNELWNIDKHRHLPLTFYGIELSDILYMLPNSGEPEFEVRILQKRPPGPFNGRTEMGRAKPISRLQNSVLSEMHVKPLLALDISFEKGPPAYGGRLRTTLESLHYTVAEILVKFETNLL